MFPKPLHARERDRERTVGLVPLLKHDIVKPGGICD